MFINSQNEELMLKLTSILECTYTDKPNQVATCFFCKSTSNKLILFTNTHVFHNCKTAKLKLTATNSGSNSKEILEATLTLGKDVIYHPIYDICTLDITKSYLKIIANGYTPDMSFFTSTGILTDYSKLHILQDIIMIGYPSGIMNTSCNHPIIRTGVTATNIKEKYNNLDIFLTDIPTFGGSSGSPILTTDDSGILYLIGINSQTFNQVTPVYSRKIPYQKTQKIGNVEIPNDIGIAINSQIINDMLNAY